MRGAIIILVVGIIVIAGTGVGSYFLFYHTGSQQQPNTETVADISMDEKYYIKEMRNGLFKYSSDEETLINLEYKDHTYCSFEDNFKVFRIKFIGGPDREYGSPTAVFDFIMTNVKHKKGNITAKLHHIYNGEILTYKLYTTDDKIILESTIKYQVLIGTESYTQAKPQTLERPDTITLSFARTTPSYINPSYDGGI